MNKRITSLLLCFVMIVTMLATAVPIFAASTDSCVYTIEADKTTAHPGDTITFTIYMQQKGNMLGLEGTLVIPAGLTFVEGSGKLTDGIKDTLGWDAVDWTPESNILNGYGSENYTSEEKLALMKFQCTIDNNAESKDYTVKLDDYLAANETGDPKEVSLIPATVTVTAAPKPATDITLNKDTLTVWEGGSDSLIATVTPSDSTDTVVWSSDNTSVATVDNTGKVTGVAVGTAKITATAGTKSATCKVTVPCNHNFPTIVPAKASDCTNRGWDQYMVCSKCNEVQSPTGEVLSGIPYKPLDTNAHDFDTTAWGYKGADGHAYTCTRNSEHHDTVYPHNPDRTAPTETEPQTCTQCGYVIAAATGHIHANHLTPVDAKAATCTEAGNTAYYKCSCGKLFVDGTASVETTATSVVLPASGHSYTVQNSDEAHKRSTAADCREYDTYWYTCANDASHNAKDDATATDKFYNGDRGAHAYSAVWTACGESGHAHKCLYDDNTVDLTAHRPDRTEPTEIEAVKCLDCGYIITPETGHVHANHLTPVDAKAATCTEAGNTAYYKCSCGKLFVDGTASVETTATSVVLPASGHSYTVQNSDEAHKRSTAADCREYDTYWYTCANDASHNAKDDATATDKFYNGDRGAHAYSAVWTACGESGHAHKCLYDDNTVDLTAHRPDRTEPTEIEAVKCLDCGYIITPETGHVHANHLTYVAAKAATCTTAGNKEYYECSCGKLFVDGTASVETTADGVVLPASGHSYTVQNSDEAHKRSTAADCREYDTYWYTCANDASHNAKDDAAATDKFYNGDRGAHAYSTDWTACGESGHAHKCLYDDNTVDLTAHRPDRTEPTETEAVKCLDCGYIITPELGHTHSLVKVEGKDADCDDNGMKEHYKCEGCNKLFEDATGSAEITDESTLVIPATGHSFVWVTDKEATEAETGLKHEECTVCHEKRNENTVIDKLVKADKADNTSKNNAEKSPKTGDDNSMGAWVAILFVSGGVLLVTGFYCRKRRSRAE